MPIPAFVAGFGTLLKFLQGLLSGAGCALEFDSNNNMARALKGGASGVSTYWNEICTKFANKIGLDMKEYPNFQNDMFNAFFKVFRPNQHWELEFSQQVETAFKNWFAVLDKYNIPAWNVEAFADFIIDIGGETQIHWWKGSGRTKIQGRFGPSHWIGKVKDLIKGFTPAKGGGGGGGGNIPSENEIRNLVRERYNTLLKREPENENIYIASIQWFQATNSTLQQGYDILTQNIMNSEEYKNLQKTIKEKTISGSPNLIPLLLIGGVIFASMKKTGA